MSDQKIVVTGEQALGLSSACLKWAVQKITGFSNRTLVSRAAKQIDDFRKAKTEARTDFLAIYGTQKGDGYTVDEVAIQKRDSKEWQEYKAARDAIMEDSITIDAFSVRLVVEISEQDLALLSADEIACLDQFLDITPIAPLIDWKAKYEAAQKQLDEIAERAKSG